MRCKNFIHRYIEHLFCLPVSFEVGLLWPVMAVTIRCVVGGLVLVKNRVTRWFVIGFRLDFQPLAFQMLLP